MVVLIVRNAGADLDRAGVNVAPIDVPAFLRGIVRSAAGEFWHAPIIAGLRDAFKRRPVLRQPDPAKNRTDGAAAVYAGGCRYLRWRILRKKIIASATAGMAISASQRISSREIPP
jgi:hypothetical protein